MENKAKNFGMRALLQERYGGNTEPVTPVQKDKTPELKEHMLKKFSAAVKAMELILSDEEKAFIEAFLTREDVVAMASGPIRFCHTGHQFLKKGLHTDEVTIEGDNGIYAIIRPDKKDRKVLNLCYPALDGQLRTREFQPILQSALQDWIISSKDLQVKGNKVNNLMPENREIAADKDYLATVTGKMMASDVIIETAKAVGNSPVYAEIYTTAVVYGTDGNGNRTTDYLFTSDPEVHAKKIGYGAPDDFATDLLQGKIEIFEISLKGKKDDDLRIYRIADIDPTQPSLFLKPNAKGYRLLLYIPEEMMQEFLNVN